MTFTRGPLDTNGTYFPGCNDDKSNVGCDTCQENRDAALCFLDSEVYYCSERFTELTNSDSHEIGFKGKMPTSEPCVSSEIEVYQDASDLQKAQTFSFSIKQNGEVQTVEIPFDTIEWHDPIYQNGHKGLNLGIGQVIRGDLDYDGDEDLLIVFGDRNLPCTPGGVCETGGVSVFAFFNEEVPNNGAYEYQPDTDVFKAIGICCDIPGHICISVGANGSVAETKIVCENEGVDAYNYNNGGCNFSTRPPNFGIGKALEAALDAFLGLFD